MTWAAREIVARCPVCQTKLQALWQSLYCPNEQRHAWVTVAHACDRCGSRELYLFQATTLQCAACRDCGRLMQGKVPKQ